MSIENHSPSSEALRYMQIGKLFDAAGLSDTGTQFDMTDFVEAADSVIPAHSQSNEYKKYLRASLHDEYQELKQKALSDSEAASYMLGSVLWRATVEHSADEIPTDVQTLERAVMTIKQSMDINSFGDIRMFHAAFAQYTEHWGRDYPAQDFHRLKKLCFHIEETIYESRQPNTLVDAAETKHRASSSRREMLLLGFVSLAFMTGMTYTIPDDIYGTNREAVADELDDDPDSDDL